MAKDDTPPPIATEVDSDAVTVTRGSAVQGTEAFKLGDLKKGEKDPRGREVRDILWAVDEFKIFRTDEGISPFFSDDKGLAAEQKKRYLAMGAGIAQYNHLIHIISPEWESPETRGTKSGTGSDERPAELVHYERELARCLAQALLGDPKSASKSLARLRETLAERIRNRARVAHLMINVMLVAVVGVSAWLVGKAFELNWFTSVYAINITELCLAVTLGSIGALFSTAVRLQKMEISPTASLRMHWIHAFQRVIVGALGATVLYFGVSSGILSSLFQGTGTEVARPTGFNPAWLAFVSALAGFSERLVPNLLEDQTRRALKDEQDTENADAEGEEGKVDA